MTASWYGLSQYYSVISQRELLPRLVQLAFHDCVGGCDGCLNIQDPNNFSKSYFAIAMLHRYTYIAMTKISPSDPYEIRQCTIANNKKMVAVLEMLQNLT